MVDWRAADGVRLITWTSLRRGGRGLARQRAIAVLRPPGRWSRWRRLRSALFATLARLDAPSRVSFQEGDRLWLPSPSDASSPRKSAVSAASGSTRSPISRRSRPAATRRSSSTKSPGRSGRTRGSRACCARSSRSRATTSRCGWSTSATTWASRATSRTNAASCG